MTIEERMKTTPHETRTKQHRGAQEQPEFVQHRLFRKQQRPKRDGHDDAGGSDDVPGKVHATDDRQAVSVTLATFFHQAGQ